MALDIVPLNPLERGQLHVLRVRAVVRSGILIAAALALALLGGAFIPPELFAWRWVLVGAVALLALWMTAFAPQRHWRHWGYAFTGSELHVAYGWLTKVHAIVPVSRVQHIDVMQGPVERAFGVARLVLFTAGTSLNVVPLPGISRATAEEIRDSIRSRIGSA